MSGEQMIRRYHSVVWNEPIIYEMGQRGTRGHTVPETEEEIKAVVGKVQSRIPANMRRKQPPNLPELSEPEVMTHYLHLSQQTFGVDSGINVGVGTCTMKYNPKLNDQLAKSPKLTEIHPFQDEETVQGILEIMYKLSRWLEEITGMNEVTLQASGGSHAVYTNCCMMRAHFKSKGELDQRTETIVPVLSHPCNAAAPAQTGFKVIGLEPDPVTGCIDIEALKATVSKHTAGMLLTDPYDTGVFDSRIEEYARIVHEAGGLILLDQANANSILGVLRAGDIGADMCHLNLHKTFSTPHGSMGPASGANGVKEEFRKFLPIPTVEYYGTKYYLNYDRPHSIGKTRGFLGNIPNIVRAYAWIMSMGAEGLREVAEVAVLNNNYMVKRLLDVPGLSLPYASRYRMQEARFSWEKLKKDTGLGSQDLNNRISDYGVQNYFTSHHPQVVNEPFTPEPTESISKTDLDRFCDIVRELSHEAYTNPEIIRTAPHNGAILKMDIAPVLGDIRKCAMTWRAYARKYGKK
jgi:glycine dehydrogenase subunit 2